MKRKRFSDRYRPNGAVGGDFFDVLALSDTKAGLFIKVTVTRWRKAFFNKERLI